MDKAVDVLVTIRNTFQQPAPIDSGCASSSGHRQSVGHSSYATETGMSSAKLCRRLRLYSAILGYGVDVLCNDWCPVWSIERFNRGGAAVAVYRRHPCNCAENHLFPQLQFLALFRTSAGWGRQECHSLLTWHQSVPATHALLLYFVALHTAHLFASKTATTTPFHG